MKLPDVTLNNVNKIVTAIHDEQTLLRLMGREKKGQNRVKLIMRIYSRYSKLRREREEQEIIGA